MGGSGCDEANIRTRTYSTSRLTVSRVAFSAAMPSRAANSCILSTSHPPDPTQRDEGSSSKQYSRRKMEAMEAPGNLPDRGPALSRPYYRGVALTAAAWNASEASLEVATKNKPEMRLYPVPCDGAVGTSGGESGTLGPTLDLPQLALHVAYYLTDCRREQLGFQSSYLSLRRLSQASPRPRPDLALASCRPHAGHAGRTVCPSCGLH